MGGTWAYWQSRVDRIAPVDLTLLNVTPETTAPPHVRCLAGDARDLSAFADQSFDLVFSNSVIGHVGGWGDQRQMAAEIRRVGRAYWVQTPNQRFPIDWRTYVPAFHWLPAQMQAHAFYTLPVGRYRRAATWAEALEWATRVRNLTRQELTQLFPEATITPERIGGFVKSYTCHYDP